MVIILAWPKRRESDWITHALKNHETLDIFYENCIAIRRNAITHELSDRCRPSTSTTDLLYGFMRFIEMRKGSRRHGLTLSAREVRRHPVKDYQQRRAFAGGPRVRVKTNERHEYATDMRLSGRDISLRYATLANFRLHVKNRSMRSDAPSKCTGRGEDARAVIADVRSHSYWQLCIFHREARFLSQTIIHIFLFT